MRKLSKKISMLMVLAMLVSLFSGIVSASAASAWSFESSKYDVDVKETITMDKNEYADFGLLKDGKEVTKATYTVKWESSDEDVVWVNAKTGQLRADKFGVAEAGDKAKISATFTNVATKKSATRYFYIEIADDAKYEIAVNFGDEAFVVGQKYDLAATVKADGKEVEAKVEFSIDGKAIDAAYTPAEAGEVTIVAVATVDGKEVAKAETKVVVAEAGLVSAKQITFDTVALTFGSADVAKAVAADISKVNSVYMLGDNEIQNFVESASVDANDATVVKVVLFNNLIKDVTYKFTYGDKSASVKGANLEAWTARSIAIANTTVNAWADVELALNLYNAEGILIKVIKNSDGSGYFTTEALNDGAYNLNQYTNEIFFHDAYATAVVKATVVMGYDENGNQIPDLTTVANVTSINAGATKDSLILGWSVVDEVNPSTGAVNAPSQNYSDNAKIGLEIDESKRLGFKFTATNIYTGEPAEHKYNGEEILGGYYITFVSTNENVVLVDNEIDRGVFHAVGAGSAQILVYRAPSWNEDAKELLGIYSVNVVANRVLTKIAPVASKKLLSTADDDSVMIKLGAKDQLGDNYADVVYVSQYSGLANAISINGTTLKYNYEYDSNTPGEAVALGCADYSGWDLFFNVKAEAAQDKETPVQLMITVKDTENWVTKTAVITLKVKNPGAISKYTFEGINTAIDTNLTTDKWKGAGRFATALKLTAYDSAGYLVDVFDNDFYASEADARTALAADIAANGDDATDKFFYTFKYNGNTKATPANDDGVHEFSAVAVSGNELIKAGKGSYSLTAYKLKKSDERTQYVGSTSIVVSDSSPAITVVKKDNKLTDVYDTDDVQSALLFGQNGAKIAFDRSYDAYRLELASVVSKIHVNPTTGNIDRVNLQSVVARENFGDFNGDGVDDYYDTKVNVYFSYEVHNP